MTDRENIARRSLPAWTYSSEAFFAAERENLFAGAWQLVCHLNDIPETGDYFTFDFLGELIVVLRGEDDEPRAFHNVCRHRAARLLDGPSGNCLGRITCPYHAWGYDMDGWLVSVPFDREFAKMDSSTKRLAVIEHEVWQGFIFVRLRPGGPSVAEQFQPYMDEIAPYRFEELQPLGRVTQRPRDANWKTIADNYVDALHIDVAHPGLKAMFGNTYGIEVKGDVHKMWGDLVPSGKDTASTRAYKEVLPEVDWLPEDKRRQWVYYRLWPNLALDIYPDQVDFMQFIPVSPTKTMIREIPYAVPDDRREMKAARYLNWRVNRQVNAEDAALIARVQQGMGSSSYTSGPFAEREILLIDSAERIRDAIPVARHETEPPAGWQDAG